MPGTAFRLSLLAGALLLLGGCNGGTYSSDPPPPPPAVPAIQSFTASPAVLEAGGSTQLTAIFSGGLGTVDPGGLAITSGVPLTVSPAFSTDYQLRVGAARARNQATAVASVALPSQGMMLFKGAWDPDGYQGWVTIGEDILNPAVQPPPGTPGLIQGLYPRTRALGANLGALAVDRTRKHLYAASTVASEIRVWHKAGVLPSQATPDRVLALPTATSLGALALDPAHDRLYVCAQTAAGGKLYVLDGASGLNGQVTPSAILDVAGLQLTLDPAHDRLFALVAGNTEVAVLEAASTLRTGALPSRTFSAAGLTLNAILVDGPGDRFYLAAGGQPAGPATALQGQGVFAFDHAGALDGPIADPAASATMRIPDVLAVGLMLDGEGRLYVMARHNLSVDAPYDEPLPTGLGVFGNASALAGTVAFPPITTLWGELTVGGTTFLEAYGFRGMDWLSN